MVPIAFVPLLLRRLKFVLACAAAVAASSAAAAPKLVPANLAPPAGSASAPAHKPSLAPASDPVTQRALEACLRDLGLDGAVAARHLGVSLVDVTDPAQPVLAQVNGDHMFYAASLPKIAILLGAFEAAAAGRLQLDASAIAELELMIRHSSNTAATDMLNRVGIDYLAQVLKSERYRLYDPSRNGGLWVGRPYASNRSAVRRDPLHNLSHGATPFQVARFYYMLETGQLVSPEASRRMKAILGSPAIHHKFVAGLTKSHPDAKLYRKSGTWRNFHADSALIERGGRRYIAVGLSDDARGGDWLKRLIVGLDAVVFARDAKPEPAPAPAIVPVVAAPL